MDSNMSLNIDKVLGIGSKFYVILWSAVLVSVAWSEDRYGNNYHFLQQTESLPTLYWVSHGYLRRILCQTPAQSIVILFTYSQKW